MLGMACYLAGDGLAARAVWEELRARDRKIRGWKRTSPLLIPVRRSRARDCGGSGDGHEPTAAKEEKEVRR